MQCYRSYPLDNKIRSIPLFVSKFHPNCGEAMSHVVSIHVGVTWKISVWTMRKKRTKLHHKIENPLESTMGPLQRMLTPDHCSNDIQLP